MPKFITSLYLGAEKFNITPIHILDHVYWSAVIISIIRINVISIIRINVTIIFVLDYKIISDECSKI